MSHQIPHDLLTRCTQHTIQCESGQGATKSDLTLFRRRDNLPENELRKVALVCHGGWSTRTKGADNLALTLVPTGSKICFFGPTGKAYVNEYHTNPQRREIVDTRSKGLVPTMKFNMFLGGSDVGLRPLNDYTVDGRSYTITGASQNVFNYQLQGHTQTDDTMVLKYYNDGLKKKEDNPNFVHPCPVDLLLLDPDKSLFLADVFSAMNSYRNRYDYEYWFFACRVASGLSKQPTFH
jgi:hypothetical protein